MRLILRKERIWNFINIPEGLVVCSKNTDIGSYSRNVWDSDDTYTDSTKCGKIRYVLLLGHSILFLYNTWYDNTRLEFDFISWLMLKQYNAFNIVRNQMFDNALNIDTKLELQSQ